MTRSEDQQDQFQKVDPDDYVDYENRYFETGGSGGSGGSGNSSRKGRKTLRAIKKQQRAQSRRQQKLASRQSIQQVLQGFPEFENPGFAERFIERYLNWINTNLNQVKPLKPADLIVQTSKSGGPGGQNINKRETRVLLTHQPTNLRSDSDQTRRQRRNRVIARKQLKKNLEAHTKDWRNYLQGKKQLTREDLDQLL